MVKRPAAYSAVYPVFSRILNIRGQSKKENGMDYSQIKKIVGACGGEGAAISYSQHVEEKRTALFYDNTAHGVQYREVGQAAKMLHSSY